MPASAPPNTTKKTVELIRIDSMNLRASYGLDECVFHGKSRPESARQSASNFAREPITNLQTPHGNVVQLTGEPGQAGFAQFENAIADSHPALQRQTTVCRL